MVAKCPPPKITLVPSVTLRSLSEKRVGDKLNFTLAQLRLWERCRGRGGGLGLLLQRPRQAREQR